MIEFLLGKTGLILSGVLACLTILGTMIGFARKAGKDAQKVEEAKARERDLENIKRADNAVATGSVSDDPNNRDNQKS